MERLCTLFISLVFTLTLFMGIYANIAIKELSDKIDTLEKTSGNCIQLA